MRGDLSDQLNRAQSAVDKDDTSNKILIGVAIFVLVAFIGAVLALTIFAVKFLDKFANTEYDGPTVINGSSLSPTYAYGGGSSSANIVYGTVENNVYHSSFSGITFAPTSDWILTSYADNFSNKDLSASGPNLATSVTIVYEDMKAYNYSSAEDALELTETLIKNQASAQYTVVDKNAVAKWGGHKFKGLIYKSEGFTSYYMEVLVTEVDGFVLEISIKGDTEDDLSIVRSYFS